MSGVFVVGLRREGLELVIEEERPGGADIEFAELRFGKFVGSRHVQRLESLAGDVDAGVGDEDHVGRHPGTQQCRKLSGRSDARGCRQRRVGIGGEISDRHLVDEGRSRPGRVDAPENVGRTRDADQRKLLHLDVVESEGEPRQGLRRIDRAKGRRLGRGRFEIRIRTGALAGETGHPEYGLDDAGGGGAFRRGTKEREERRSDERLGIRAAHSELITERTPTNAVFRHARSAGIAVFFVAVGGRKFEQAQAGQVHALARHGHANLGEAGINRAVTGNGVEEISVLPTAGRRPTAEGVFIGSSDEFFPAIVNPERGAKRAGGQIEE